VKIIVADDHMIVRRGMQLIVAKRPGWTIAGEAATDAELFAALHAERFDVAVIDLKLRDRSGLDILEQLRREFPALPVLILSSLPEEQYAVHCLRAGARGYVQKDSSADDILDAIANVAIGRTWVSPAVTGRMADALSNPQSREVHEMLSPREFDVFRLIAVGRSMTEIAASMKISNKTPSTYRTRIFEQTGFNNNAD
jgi:DNA-binding NarL/FixJ family response regulator